MPSLSVIIITKNSGPGFADTLAGVKFADEVIVVDSGSHDQTRDLAFRFGAKFIPNPWPGYGRQKNFGASLASGDWLLFLDSDEVITPGLQKDIIQAISHPLFKVYWLRSITVFLGKHLRHLYGHNPRLVRRDAAKWNTAPVHEQLVRTRISGSGTIIKLKDPDTGLLNEPLIHNSHTTISSYLKKMHHYTSLDASNMAHTLRHRSGRPVGKSFLLPYFLAVRQFIKLFLYRRGILDGIPGTAWCLLSSYYEYEMAKKYLRLVK